MMASDISEYSFLVRINGLKSESNSKYIKMLKIIYELKTAKKYFRVLPYLGCSWVMFKPVHVDSSK